MCVRLVFFLLQNGCLVECLFYSSIIYIIWQQPLLPGGPTTSTLLAANFFMAPPGLSRATSAPISPRGSPRLRALGSTIGFMLMSAGTAAGDDKDRVLEEFDPVARICDRDRLRSARVPVEKLLFWPATIPGLMVTETWMLMGSVPLLLGQAPLPGGRTLAVTLGD